MNFVPTFNLPPASRFSTTAVLLVISNHLIWCFKRSVFLSLYFFQWSACSASVNGASSTFSAKSARNALSVFSAFPLRESLEPVFSIEFVPAFGSVFSAFLPTVGCPFYEYQNVGIVLMVVVCCFYPFHFSFTLIIIILNCYIIIQNIFSKFN